MSSPATSLVMSNATATDDLTDLLVETDNFGLFTVIGASHATELNAVGISGRDAVDGYVFMGFLPYGTEVRVR